MAVLAGDYFTGASGDLVVGRPLVDVIPREDSHCRRRLLAFVAIDLWATLPSNFNDLRTLPGHGLRQRAVVPMRF